MGRTIYNIDIFVLMILRFLFNVDIEVTRLARTLTSELYVLMNLWRCL